MVIAVASLLLAPGLQKATYTNPVFPANFPDPYVAEYKGTYYAYATHKGGDGFQCLTSKDLVNWKEEAAVGRPSWSHDQMWAPEVYPFGKKWYFLFSALNYHTRKRDIGISIGDSPMGPFTDYSVLVNGKDENDGGSEDGAIDGTIYSEKGKRYLLYIKEAAPRALKIVELSPDLKRTVGEAKPLLRPTLEQEKGILDAPTLIKRDGTYWLLFSAGYFQSWKKDACYRVWAAKSRSLLGPYTKLETPVLDGVADKVYNPGHQCIFQTPNGDWWMGYHGWDAEGHPLYGQNPRGRSFRIDPLKWTKDGPRVVGPSTTPQPAPRVK